MFQWIFVMSLAYTNVGDDTPEPPNRRESRRILF